MKAIVALFFFSMSLIVASAGCICVPADSQGNFHAGPITYRAGACDSCGPGCGSHSAGDFYASPAPLARFFGWTSCGSGGCGELYVDEWLNEPPRVDECGYGECLNCGRSPLRTLLHAIAGRRYMGSCETCSCDEGIMTADGAIVQDGYQPGTWSARRRCDCSAPVGNGRAIESDTFGDEFETIDPSGGQGDPMPRDSSIRPPPVQMPPKSPSGSPRNGKLEPTPAPELPPTSASRLNPAARRVLR